MSQASVALESLDNVQVHVALWQSRGEIAFEVQRRKGDSDAFNRYARCLLDAASGNFKGFEYEKSSGDIDILFQEAMVSTSTSEQEQEHAMAALYKVHDLFKRDRMEMILDGMESLVVLADPRKTGVVTSINVSNAVLLGVGPNQESSWYLGDIRDFLIMVIHNRDFGADLVPVSEALYFSDDYDEADEAAVMQIRNLALSVLCLTLEVIAKTPELHPGRGQDSVRSFLDRAQGFSDKNFLSTLVAEVSRAKQAPHVAYRTVKALRLFGASSDSVRQELMDLKAFNAATIAYKYGVTNHKRLEIECRRFLVVLLAVEAAPIKRRDCLVVFQAEPLVWEDHSGGRHAMLSIDTKGEKKRLMNIVKEAKSLGFGEIRLIFEKATSERLGALLATGCSSILHLSCHGNPEYLALEIMGAMQQLLVDDLKHFIEASSFRPRVIFLSACYSGAAGQALVAAGVDHVICCKRDERLRDSAATAFAQTFYTALVSGKHSLKAAFQLARHAVKCSPLVQDSHLEMDKFQLLPEKPDGDPYHEVPVFYTLPSPHVAAAMQPTVLQRNIPPTPEEFLGREVVVYQILKEVQASRFVSVEGPRGIGKSSVAKAALNYISDRSHQFNFDQYFWLPTVHKPNDNIFKELCSLMEMIKNDGIHQGRDKEWEECCGNIVTSLYGIRALIVIDARELNADTGLKKLEVFLNHLLLETRSVRALIVCPAAHRIFLGTHYVCGRVFVEPLDTRSTMFLFGNLCKFVQEQYIEGVCSSGDLVTLFIPEIHGEALPMSARLSEIFSLVGEGNPSKIWETAMKMSAATYNKLIQKGIPQLEENISLVSAQLQCVASTEKALTNELQYTLSELKELRGKLPSLTELNQQHAKLVGKPH